MMTPCGEHTMVHVEACRWHSLEAIEEGAIVFEEKDGKYESLEEEDVMMGK